MTGMAARDAAFVDLASRVLDDVVARRPEQGTYLGDHRGDDRLADLSPAALDDERRAVSRFLAELAELDTAALATPDAVDAAVLTNMLETRRFELDDLREHEWDPSGWNPGTAVYLLLARDYAPLGDRLRAAAGRLAAIPEHLALARRTLGDMPRVHVETAVGQFTGTRTLLATELERALTEQPALRAEVEPARDAAVEAIDAHLGWLREQLDDDVRTSRDPRIGPELYARKLSLTLDSALDAETVLRRAEDDLTHDEAAIAELAARLDGRGAGGSDVGDGDRALVRSVLDRLAGDAPVDDASIVGLCERALASTTDFVRQADLVTVHDDPAEIIVMPEIHRGVAVAYCDPPGPLEPRPLPTYFAVSPTPAGWPEKRVRSFYREYNGYLLHNLTVHEAMPGHLLQLAHSRRYAGSTPTRAAFWSGPFVEGWAVYSEEFMVGSGYGADVSAAHAAAIGMQQLKMRLRMTINAILDVRVHAHGMTEREAMALLTGRGHQEEGEAAGKWRRALLTSAQLSTYYVGYVGVADALRSLRAARPGHSARRLHDDVLAHGSPPPRHLAALLGLAPAA